MKQNLFKAIVVAGVAVAMLYGGKSAKADIVGVGLGYDFGREFIAVDFLIPLEHHGAKRPRGGVLNLGINIRGGFRKRGIEGTNFDWIGFSTPVTYEHVFGSGISILAGAEFRYYSSDEDRVDNDQYSFDTSSEKRTDYGGGIVLGTHYFFKSGVFLGFRVSAGISYSTYAYERASVYNSEVTNLTYTNSSEEHTTIYGYAAPTLSVGYMF